MLIWEECDRAVTRLRMTAILLSDRKLWITAKWLTGFYVFKTGFGVLSPSCSQALCQNWPDQGSNVCPSSTDRKCCLTYNTHTHTHTHTNTHSDPLAAAAEGDYGSGWQMNSRLVWSKDQASSVHCFLNPRQHIYSTCQTKAGGWGQNKAEKCY